MCDVYSKPTIKIGKLENKTNKGKLNKNKENQHIKNIASLKH